MSKHDDTLEIVATTLLIQGHGSAAKRLLHAAGTEDATVESFVQIDPFTIEGVRALANRSAFSPNEWPHSALVKCAGEVDSPERFEDLVTALFAVIDDNTKVRAIAAVVAALPESVVANCLKWSRQDGRILTNFAKAVLIASFLQRADSLHAAAIDPASTLGDALSALELYREETEWRWRVLPWHQTQQLTGRSRLELGPRWAHAWALAIILRFAEHVSIEVDLEMVRRRLFELLYTQLRATELWNNIGGENMGESLMRVIDALGSPGIGEDVHAEFARLQGRWSEEAEF